MNNISPVLIFTNQTLDDRIDLGDYIMNNKIEKILKNNSESEIRHLHGQVNNYSNLDYILDDNQQPVYNFNIAQYIPEHALLVIKNERFAPVPVHVHDCIEINYMYSGNCEQIIDGHQINLKKGQMSFIDTRTPHSIGYTGQDDILLNFAISKQFLAKILLAKIEHNNLVTSFFVNSLNSNNHNLNYLIFNTQNNKRIRLFLDELLLEYHQPSTNAMQIINSLFVLIILEIINNIENNIDLKSITKSNSILIKTINYLESNYQHCTLVKTAQHVNVNPCYLTTLLKKNFGLSYKELLIQIRMEASAKLLITTDESIEVVSNQCGYNNLNFFYQKFKAHFNCTPKQYRNNHKNQLPF